MRFATPEFLLLIPALIGIFYMFSARLKSKAVINFSQVPGSTKGKPSLKLKLSKYLKYLRYAVLLLFIIALARPQTGQVTEEVLNHGIDIIMAIDTSTSMMALDFKPLTRMDAAKRFAVNFVKARSYDRLGLVVFSGEAFTLVPVTSDKNAVLNAISSIEAGMTQVDGTAIGSAVVTSINRLIESPAKSRVIVLITDGNNNMGEVDPVTAANIAAQHNIRIYAIGAGSPEGAEYEVLDANDKKILIRAEEEDLDEETLKQIASVTGGAYFRVLSTKAFNEAMAQINALERTDIKSLEFSDYNERFGIFLWAAFLLLMLEIFLSNTILRRLP
jgi:Ca-activated chloride channel family protein